MNINRQHAAEMIKAAKECAASWGYELARVMPKRIDSSGVLAMYDFRTTCGNVVTAWVEVLPCGRVYYYAEG